jgi:hypothetical protein
MQEALANPSQTPPRSTPDRERDIKRDNDELATLGGKTRLVPRRSTNSTPSSPASNAGSLASPISSPFIASQLPPATYPSPNPGSASLAQAAYGQGPASIQPSLASHPSPIAHLLQHHTMHPPMDPTVQWPGYTQATPLHMQSTHYPSATDTHGAGDLSSMMDYTTYTLPPEPWQNTPPLNLSYPTAPHPAGQSNSVYIGDQYPAAQFDLATSMRASTYLVGSPQSQMHQPSTPMNEMAGMGDPTAAWHSLVSQFNHI